MKQSILYKSLLISATLLSFAGCQTKKDVPPTNEVKLNITGLPNLGAGYAYEGWIIVDGTPVTTGTFTVDDNGAMSKTTFNITHQKLDQATRFVVSIEPVPDPNQSPTDIHVIAGDFSGDNASLSISHTAAIGNNFMGASGSYILATPTNGMGTNEKSGVWFLNPGMAPTASLNLPTLPTGWKYEGWAVINGTPVTTGKFSMASGADESAPYSGTMPGPAFPGEDFLMNAPAGLTFPTDLSGQKIVITLEPNPDNSPAPFMLKPLSGDVPANAMEGTTYSLMNTISVSNISGTATR